MGGRSLIGTALAGLLCLESPALAAEPPAATAGEELALAGRVTDAAGLFEAEQRAALTDELAAIEARTKHQIVVATIATLGGQDIIRYARDLGNRWKIGRRGVDDGVVILVAPNEQLVRIAVGFGLESVLTDAVCQQIINEVMLPQFREGRLYEGVSQGVAALNAKL